MLNSCSFIDSLRHPGPILNNVDENLSHSWSAPRDRGREIEAAGAYIFRRGLHIEQVVLGRVTTEFPGFLGSSAK